MSKGKKHAKPAADDPHAAGAGAADDAGAAGAGQDAAEAAGADAAQPADAVDTGPQPGAADAGPDAPDAGAAEAEAAEGEEATAGNGAWDLNIERATFAAGHAYGQDGSFAGYTVDDDSLDLPEHLRLMEAAAAFVRANADAPAEAIPIHLKLKGFRDLPETGPREIVAWRVFAFTLMQLDRLDAEQAALATASPVDAAPPVAAAGDMALMPQPGGFAPTGFTPRR